MIDKRIPGGDSPTHNSTTFIRLNAKTFIWVNTIYVRKQIDRVVFDKRFQKVQQGHVFVAE